MDKKYLDKFYKEMKDNKIVVGEIVVPMTLIYNSLLNSSKYIHEQYNLTHTEMETLISLYKNGGRLSPTELYKALIFSSSAMAKVLKKLEQKELIQREASSTDKRSMLVVLTAKGSQIGEDCLTKIKTHHEKFFDFLDNKEKDDLKKILKKIVYAV
jgi:DNA-binding MarR family transcriptional regulator